jgi:hypothetical protein
MYLITYGQLSQSAIGFCDRRLWKFKGLRILFNYF